LGVAVMTAAEFKRKWHGYTSRGTSANQEHFNDLCRLQTLVAFLSLLPTAGDSPAFELELNQAVVD